MVGMMFRYGDYIYPYTTQSCGFIDLPESYSPGPLSRNYSPGLFTQPFGIMDTQSTVNVPDMIQQPPLRALLDLWHAIFPDDLTSTILALSTLYAATICIVALVSSSVAYRLSPFHPLASIPGPTFARASGLYRAYHEIWRGGKMIEALQKLHKIYGPVIRIGPNDVHFATPEAYHTIYNARSKVTKDPWLYKCFSEDESSFGYTDPVAAKARRHQMAPFFSRQNILSLQGKIMEKVDLLCEKLSHTIAGGAQCAVVDIGSAIKSMTMDAVMSVCLGESLNALEDPRFRHPVLEFMEQSLPLIWVFKHIPIIRVVMLGIPDGVSEKMGAHGILLLKKKLREKLEAFLSGLGDPDVVQNTSKHGPSTNIGSKDIIFHHLLDENKKPVAHYGSLFDEAQALFVAGSDTVGNALSLGTFYILSNAEVHSNLRKELKQTWPSGDLKDISTRPRWEDLEKLPYLTAVLKETLRLSHGVVSPLSRIVPAQGLTVDGVFMPPGTVISSSAPLVHLNKRLFPDPHVFKPERWLSQESKELEKHIVAFSRGPRSCVGMNLAWCEMYLTLASLFRKFDLVLFETGAKDIEYKDYFVPCFHGRIRVTVKQRCD